MGESWYCILWCLGIHESVTYSSPTPSNRGSLHCESKAKIKAKDSRGASGVNTFHYTFHHTNCETKRCLIMTDLADLFSTTSPPRSPLRPPTDTLFLSPSSSIAPTPQARRNNSSHNRPTSPPPPPLNFDDDLGDLDLDFDLSDLPPPLTERDVNGSRLIPVDDPLAALDFGRRDGGDEERVGKKRKPVAKIDADRYVPFYLLLLLFLCLPRNHHMRSDCW